MYAFIDLTKRMFLLKEPDEPANPTQRATLVRKVRSVAATYPESVITLVHLDDLTDETDWQCETIIGPKGGNAIVQASQEEVALDLPVQKVKEMDKELRRKLQDIQNQFTSDVAKLYAEHSRRLLSMIRSKAGKVAPALVLQAGYDKDGNWLDQGTLPRKKGKR